MRRSLLLAMLTLSIASSTISCVSERIHAIASDQIVVRMTNGVPYRPSCNGWFVPDARMLQILNALPPDK